MTEQPEQVDARQRRFGSDEAIVPQLVPAEERRRCTAHNASGGRCGRAPVPGGTGCRFHGGAAPQVQQKAKLRLLELAEPAVATLAREMTNTKARPIERIKAAAEILDRIYGKQVTIENDTARDMLVQRLLGMREQVLARMAEQNIEGETVDDE